MRLIRSVIPLALLAVAVVTSGGRAEDVKVTRLRVQRVGDDAYFRITLTMPRDLVPPQLNGQRTAGQRWALARLPRLVPQDTHTRNVCFVPDFLEELEFVGRVDPNLDTSRHDLAPDPKGPPRDYQATFLLLYPTIDRSAASDLFLPEVDRAIAARTMAEVQVRVDFRRAEHMPHLNPRPNFPEHILATNLEQSWARAQSIRFSALEAMTDGFGFYSFAREALNRRYAVSVEAIGKPSPPTADELYRRVYEDLSGDRDVLDALTLHRLLGPTRRDTGRRVVDVGTVPGIEAPAWLDKLPVKQVTPEPLAKLVPHDNWYVHFKDVRKTGVAIELLQQMASAGLTSVGLSLPDELLKERYERQLCLRGVGENLTPELVAAVALTGSDLSFREGTDLTVAFQVADRAKFLAAVQPGLDTVRRAFPRLRETRDSYQGVPIESFETRFREVSLHRAAVDNVVFYSNSPAGLIRVLDAVKGREKPLAESREFQNLRSTFDAADKQEDAFVCLTDAFLRRLASPALRVKQKRRLEALAVLRAMTNAAVLMAWDVGRLPSRPEEFLAEAGLRPEELEMPEGSPAEWYGLRSQAVSEVYNTLEFATPLVELPAGRITRVEERDYLRFRADASAGWRRYLEPMGVRLKFDDDRVQVDAHVFQANPASQLGQLRAISGGGTTRTGASGRKDDALVQLLMHVHPETSLALGEWGLLRLDDGSVLGQLSDAWIREELELGPPDDATREARRLVFQTPALGAIKVGDARELRNFLTNLKTVAGVPGPDWEETTEKYRGLTVTRWRAKADGPTALAINNPGTPKERQFLPAVYHVEVNGVFWVAVSREVLHDAIDRALASGSSAGGGAEVNGVLTLSPRTAARPGDGLGQWLEFRCQQLALAGGAEWYALYHSGLLPPDAPAEAGRGVALRLFGFAPSSPDGSKYEYEVSRDEVVNDRHGTAARPKLRPGLDKESWLGRLVEATPKVRAEWRFDENAARLSVTVERTPSPK